MTLYMVNKKKQIKKKKKKKTITLQIIGIHNIYLCHPTPVIKIPMQSVYKWLRATSMIAIDFSIKTHKLFKEVAQGGGGGPRGDHTLPPYIGTYT